MNGTAYRTAVITTRSRTPKGPQHPAGVAVYRRKMITIKMKNGTELVFSMPSHDREKRLAENFKTSWGILKLKNRGRPDTQIPVGTIEDIEFSPVSVLPDPAEEKLESTMDGIMGRAETRKKEHVKVFLAAVESRLGYIPEGDSTFDNILREVSGGTEDWKIPLWVNMVVNATKTN